TRSGRRWRRGCLRTAIPGMAWFYRRTRSGRRWRRGSLRTDLAQPQAGLREAEQLGVDRLDLAGRDRLEITPRLERGGRAHVEQHRMLGPKPTQALDPRGSATERGAARLQPKHLAHRRPKPRDHRAQTLVQERLAATGVSPA